MSWLGEHADDACADRRPGEDVEDGRVGNGYLGGGGGEILGEGEGRGWDG